MSYQISILSQKNKNTNFELNKKLKQNCKSFVLRKEFNNNRIDCPKIGNINVDKTGYKHKRQQKKGFLGDD